MAYRLNTPTIATSRMEAARMEAAPFTLPLVSSKAGSYCSVTKAKYSATLKIRANT
ncbi:hypothetical protein D3C73_1554700 [compost metagenome]